MSILHAPAPFRSDDGSHIVFAEFTRSKHSLEFDIRTKRTVAESKIRFRTYLTGHPVIDLYLEDEDNIRDVEIDGSRVQLQQIASPRDENGNPYTYYRVPSAPIPPGEHRISIGHEITHEYVTPRKRPIQYIDRGVSCLFRMNDEPHPSGDVEQREFLERYLPANLEFDRYPIRIDCRITGSADRHTLITNARRQHQTGRRWSARFPGRFGPSSVFYFMHPNRSVRRIDFEFPRSSGVPVAVSVLAKRDQADHLTDYADELWLAFAHLDEAIGAFPYDSFTLVRGFHAMEYAGAAEAGTGNVLHELLHSYIGRCVMPANGNAAWIDEAIAYWWENGRPRYQGRPPDPENLGNRASYIRTTHPKAETTGALLMGHISYVLRDRGGLEAFIRWFVAKRRFSCVTSLDLQRDLEEFGRTSFHEIFGKFVFGTIN